MSGLDDMTVSQPEPESVAPSIWAASKLGGALTDVDAERGFVRHAHELSSAHTGKAQLLALLDEALCVAVRVRGDGCVKADLMEIQAHFLAPPQGARVFSEGEITRWGRSVVFVEARLTDESGVVCARATSTARLLKSAPEHRRSE